MSQEKATEIKGIADPPNMSTVRAKFDYLREVDLHCRHSYKDFSLVNLFEFIERGRRTVCLKIGSAASVRPQSHKSPAKDSPSNSSIRCI
jgi:hypothetical protein